jgi:hypothetical protein
VVGNKVVNTAFFIARQGKQGVFAYRIVGVACTNGINGAYAAFGRECKPLFCSYFPLI